MSQKKCIRKVWPLIDPVAHAILGARVTSRQDMDKLVMREIGALDAIIKGHGTLKEWNDLVAMNNLTQTLAGQGVGYEAMEAAHRAEAALIDAAERFQRTKIMGFTGEGIQAIRDVLAYHDLQRSCISRSQYERAIQLTIARVKSGYSTIDLDATLGKPVAMADP